MFSCKIGDIKSFMNKLLIKEDFDKFAVSEATIITYNSFVIDGHLRKEHFTEDEWRELGGERFSAWETIKPFCFQAIKGKKTPESFKIVLLLSEKDKNEFYEDIKDKPANISAGNINGLFLNIKYENGALYATTGTSLGIFVLDKTIDTAWESYVKNFFLEHEIEFEEI
ncbi:MAG: hypothetical protein IJW18_09510 [Lachnospiraceae bacterium]|nr:hypothetical protein [Lachnospiraceae bacterium]